MVGTQHIRRFLDTVGDGTGSKVAKVDGSSTPVVFRVKPAPGEILSLTALFPSFTVTDPQFASGYGTPSPLANGILVEQVRVAPDLSETVVVDWLAGTPITRYEDWSRYPGRDQLSALNTAFLNFVYNVEFELTSDGAPLLLIGDDGDELRVTIRDDLTSLLFHQFLVSGFQLS